MRSPHCQMDKTNLARVFGPTIVGHGMAEPPPRTILKDTTTQPRVSLLVPGLANGRLQDICWTFTSCTLGFVCECGLLRKLCIIHL